MSTSSDGREGSITGRLKAALEGHDLAAARVLVAQLQALLDDPQAALPDGDARDALIGLFAHRWFDLAEQLGRALVARPGVSAAIARRHAQALIELGRYDEALERLEALRKRKDLSDTLLDEVMGHVGRARKEQFLASVRAGKPHRTRLQQAFDAYHARYRIGPASHLWHGINAVALADLAVRHELVLKGAIDPRATAERILGDVVDLRENRLDTPYDSATAAEACIALGRHADAMPWLERYLGAPDITIFQIGATLRQFEQLWALDQGPPEAQDLLMLLRTRQAASANGRLVLDAAGWKAQRLQAAAGRLESVFGGDRFDSLRNYRDGLARFESVVRVSRTDGSGGGTGFVLPGRLLSKNLPDALVLVTNAHVLSEDDAQRRAGALHPTEVVVRFHGRDDVPSDRDHTVRAPLLFSSPPDQLDCAIAAFETPPPPPKVPLPVAQTLPVVNQSTQIRIIGHPEGGGISLSVSVFLDHEAQRLHYRTATEGGSSGSPAFTSDWRLVGLHHAGGPLPRLRGQVGTYDANEGISIAAIRQALDALPPPG